MSNGVELVPYVPAWNADLLKIHMDEKVEELKRSLALLRAADQTAVSAALAAAEKAVITALASAEKATDKYEREVERWRSASNEWRDAMNDRELKFLPRDAYMAAHNPLLQEIADLKKSRDQAQGRQTATTIILGVVFAVITVVLRFI